MTMLTDVVKGIGKSLAIIGGFYVANITGQALDRSLDRTDHLCEALLAGGIVVGVACYQTYRVRKAYMDCRRNTPQ